MPTRDERKRLLDNARRIAAAAGAGDLKQVKALAKADPAAAALPHGIMAACGGGHAKVVAHFLDRGVSPDIQTAGEMSYTPLLRAIYLGKHDTWTPAHREVVELLLERGADVEKRGLWGNESPIAAAAMRGNAEAVELLREHDAGRNLFDAAITADLPRVKAMLKKDPSRAKAVILGGDKHRTALRYCLMSHLGDNDPAALKRLVAIAELLIAHGSPVDETEIEGKKISAALPGHPALMKVVLAAGADPGPVLGSAAFHGDRESMRLLIDAGADLNRVSYCGRENTVLNECMRWGHLEPAFVLLDAKADPNIPDANGWTAAHYAASRGVSVEVFERLRAGGADLSRRANSGATPLAIAAQRKRANLVAWLKANGGN